MTKPDLRKPPPRPDPDRAARLDRLAQWHRQWSRRHRGASTLRPRGEGSDYNQHHLDVDGADAAAEDEFHDRARRIMGIDARRSA
jgi:hypothetical protein